MTLSGRSVSPLRNFSLNLKMSHLAATPGMAVSLFDSCLITFLVWQERRKIKRKRSEIENLRQILNYHRNGYFIYLSSTIKLAINSVYVCDDVGDGGGLWPVTGGG